MIRDYYNCTGCRACEQICNNKAIIMQSDILGFMYPEKDKELCINCQGLCLKVCPMFRDDLQNKIISIYAAKNLCKEQVIKSSSGGIFPVLAINILKQNGVVFGCAYDENMMVIHIAVENVSELFRLQGSKYVQSNTLDTYKNAKEYLEQNREVLYSGLPCQIAGLKAFLEKEYDNLITVDLICKGVPSPGLFSKYLEWLGKKMGGKIIEYNFRSKEKHGWKQGNEKVIKTKTKTKTITARFDKYYLGFQRNETLRESCYSCKYACKERTGDITLGDYWGIKEEHPEFYSNSGVSVVLINTNKGIKIWENIIDKVDTVVSNFDKASKKLNNLKYPTNRPVQRDFFNINNFSFKISLFYYFNIIIINRIKKYIKKHYYNKEIK